MAAPVVLLAMKFSDGRGFQWALNLCVVAVEPIRRLLLLEKKPTSMEIVP